MLRPPKQFEPAQKLLGRETPNSPPRLQNARCGGPPFTARQMTGRSGWRCSGRHPACSESPKKPGCMRSSRKRWSYRASIGCDSPTCTGKLRNPLPSAAAGPFAGSAGCVTMCAAEDACWARKGRPVRARRHAFVEGNCFHVGRQTGGPNGAVSRSLSRAVQRSTRNSRTWSVAGRTTALPLLSK